MPSPIGHSLAGLTVGWLADPTSARSQGRLLSSLAPLALSCAAIAALPDADLLVGGWHRTATHSVTATAFVFIVTAVVTGKVTGRVQWRWAAMLAAAHATHMLLDWLGTDRFPPPGVQLFWPFSDQFYLSRLDIFPPVERRLLRPDAVAINVRAATWELLIMGPIAALSWLVRRRRAAWAKSRLEAEPR
jgi:inner membrane protein